ncbi:hypothetical protein KAR48_17710 [bacterium]|nr:hypothetical protein [bacterium]
MKRKNILLSPTFAILLLFIFSCNRSPQFNFENVKIEKKFDALFDIVKTNSINSDKVNWQQLKYDVYSQAQNYQCQEDTYPLVRYVLRSLKDNHSFFLKCSITDIPNVMNRGKPPIYPTGTQLSKDLFYLEIPGFLGDSLQTIEYVKKAWEVIESFAIDQPMNWIIDLSENSGGNMWPMYASVGPILGNGTHGYFRDNKHKTFPWIYKSGNTFEGDSQTFQITGMTPPIIESKKVVILISDYTGSSGEAIATAFHARENTIFVGSKTSGLVTGNQVFILPDSTLIALASSQYMDGNKKIIEGPIIPDIPFSLAEIKKTEPTGYIKLFENWFLNE